MNTEFEQKDNIPDILYRGITVTPSQLNETDFFSSPLKPGTLVVDDEGKKTVQDGNEYGVYMTSNELMARTAYYGRSIEAVPLMFQLSWSRGVERVISLPSVGILFEINTKGLKVREPEITPTLEGVYNNGFEGAEYIADEIPSSIFTVKQMCLSKEVYDRNAVLYDIKSKQDYDTAVKDINRRYNEYINNVNRFKESLNSLNQQERLNPRIVEPIYNQIFKRKDC